MKKFSVALALLIFGVSVSLAQKGQAEADYYPRGYSGDTWAGEVTAIDNAQRTLTLTNGSGKNAVTFVAAIPDAPYEWARDVRKERVLDFPYDKKAKSQMFQYQGAVGEFASLLPNSDNDRAGTGTGQVLRPNPPDSDRITDFTDFMGRRIKVYYTARERKSGDQSVKYNDVWRIRILSKKK